MDSGPRRVPLLSVLYDQYLSSQDSAPFLARVSQTYSQGTLERLSGNESPQVRRAAVVALGFLADYGANTVMGRALHDDDRTVRTLAENGIRNLWSRAGNQQQRQELGVIVRLNAAQHYEEARQRAACLIEQAAWFAEAWSQRAFASYALGDYAAAIRDCHEALEINAYHFVAASKMGQAYLQLGNQVSALESFRRALRLNPDLEGVRVQVARLARNVEGNK